MCAVSKPEQDREMVRQVTNYNRRINNILTIVYHCRIVRSYSSRRIYCRSEIKGSHNVKKKSWDGSCTSNFKRLTLKSPANRTLRLDFMSAGSNMDSSWLNNSRGWPGGR